MTFHGHRKTRVRAGTVGTSSSMSQIERMTDTAVGAGRGRFPWTRSEVLLRYPDGGRALTSIDAFGHMARINPNFAAVGREGFQLVVHRR